MTVVEHNIPHAPTNGNFEPGQLYRLNRGGYILNTSSGYIQFGSPPETIKDTTLLKSGVPLIYCLPHKVFNRDRGITLAEVEFPIFYNFFIQLKKTTIICDERKKDVLSELVHSAVFGMEEYNIADDYFHPENVDIPSIKKESSYFRNFKFNDMASFKSINEKSSIKMGKVDISINKKGQYIITDKLNDFKTVVPRDIVLDIPEVTVVESKKIFHPPFFGITTLGASDGFDPHDNTSGFLLWIAETGILIDPPVNFDVLLKKANIDLSTIEVLILTHTHADHDTGTFQQILSDKKITIYTTKTVMDSWIYKYSRVSELSVKELSSLFNFNPVMIDEDINILGANFKFHYTLHSIPTLGFSITFRNITFTFSGDHLNDPSQYLILYKKGYLSKRRYDEFLQFNWDSDIIFHEAGYPPLHTPVSYLNSLPTEVQKKIVVYHIAKKDMPAKTDLRRAETGVENTITFDVKKNDF